VKEGAAEQWEQWVVAHRTAEGVFYLVPDVLSRTSSDSSERLTS